MQVFNEKVECRAPQVAVSEAAQRKRRPPHWPDLGRCNGSSGCSDPAASMGLFTVRNSTVVALQILLLHMVNQPGCAEGKKPFPWASLYQQPWWLTELERSLPCSHGAPVSVGFPLSLGTLCKAMGSRWHGCSHRGSQRNHLWACWWVTWLFLAGRTWQITLWRLPLYHHWMLTFQF